MSPTEPRPHRMLWSYHFARKADVGAFLRKMATPPVLFADSGGFSALTQGVSIDLGEYAEWLTEHRDHFEVYANLDAIGDAKATLKNQQALEARGLRPLPVYHGGAPQKYLDHYADAGHTYIALGGTVGVSAAVRMRWFLQAFMWAQRRRDAGKSSVVFHGFGVTTPALLAALPWYSVDSTTWHSSARFARLSLFNPITAAWCEVDMFDAASVVAGTPLIRHYGADPQVFLSRASYHFSDAIKVSAHSWRAFEDHCRRRHGPVPYPNEPERPAGLHLYLADGSETNHVTANHALTGAAP